MAEKKLKYKEVPKALAYVIKTLWTISPGYVLLSLFMTIKDKLLPFVTLFIVADITTRLPELIQQKQNFMVVIWLLAAVVAIELSNRLFDIFANAKQKRIEVRVTLHLREHFYKAYARLPYRLYEDKEVIDAFQYADTFMYRFSRFGLQQIARAIGSVAEIAVSIIALLAVAWFMPLLFVLFLPFLVISILRLNREQARIFLENRGAQRRLWAIENLFYPRKIKETRLYGVVDYFLGQRRKHSQKIEMRDVNITIKRDRMSFWQDVQMQALSLIASGVAVWRIAFQSAPLGIFVLAQQLTSRAAGAVKSLFIEISEFDQDLYGFAEYRYITETLQVPTRDLPVIATQPEISLKAVSFTYPQADKSSLTNVSLSIPFGRSLAVVGENGAGKTTLTRLLLGLYHPQKGVVSVGGTSLTDLNEESWLRRIGVLLQDFGMDEDMTVRDAVWLGDITKPKDDDLIMEVLEAVELDDVIKKEPHGLGSYLGKWIEEEKGIELSGGQLQRLAIARALFREPDVLILDEPTSAIDANAEERIFSRLMASRKGKTTIFISHRFSTVRRAEHIAFMEHGKLTEYGTHADLMAKNGNYAHMFTTQAEGYK